ENRPGAKFCSECATPFGIVCPTCSTTNAAGAKFCSECATPLQTGAAAGARAGMPATATTGLAALPSSATGGTGRTGADGPVAERRLVTVLFADLVGWTPFAADKDAEDVRETLSRYFDLSRDVIGRYGGTVEKFIGDAVMAVWGAPVAQEDDAERA